MVDYKERMIEAKKIFDERNPTKKQNKKNSSQYKRIKREIDNKKASAKKMASDYFKLNEKKFIDDTLEHFIYCIENAKGEFSFSTTYDMVYENYPSILLGFFAGVFLSTLSYLIKESLVNKAADFCEFNVDSSEYLDKGYNSENSSKFKFCIKISMSINK